MMGGEIWIKSELGKGSAFSFTVKLKYGAENDAQVVLTEDDDICFEGRRVLLAEDVEINREIVMALLEPTQLEIDCAINGAQALNMYKQKPDAYDLIFMDLQMPEMDGYEATRRIRALPHQRAGSVPIIAMTANVFREDVEKCISAGMNDHLGKPLKLEEVISLLNKYLTV
jgi:CheY-like chemotaxis protein